MQWKSIFFGLVLGYLGETFIVACKPSDQVIKAPRADEIPKIDGVASDKSWQKAQWYSIDKIWMGNQLQNGDFEGRFKVVWTTEKLFILVEIKDEKISVNHSDFAKAFAQDDCLLIFIDEDHSGGNYQFNHNAFAYHISQDYRVLNYDSQKKIRAYTIHFQVKRSHKEGVYTWELSLSVYNDTYQDKKPENQLVKLKLGKKMGWMVAYGDTDEGENRENYIGSIALTPNQQKHIWQDAGIFGVVELIE